MKNIQIIDGAQNCAYSIFQIDDEVFCDVFGGKQQNIAFVEDLVVRLGETKASNLLARCWSRRIEKENVVGIHGTLFFGLEFKRVFYPNLREADLDDPEIQRNVGAKLKRIRDKKLRQEGSEGTKAESLSGRRAK